MAAVTSCHCEIKHVQLLFVLHLTYPAQSIEPNRTVFQSNSHKDNWTIEVLISDEISDQTIRIEQRKCKIPVETHRHPNLIVGKSLIHKMRLRNYTAIIVFKPINKIFVTSLINIC